MSRDRTDALLWTSASDTHDWSDGAVVQDVLTRAVDHGFITALDWARAGFDETSVEVPAHEPSALAAVAWSLLPPVTDWSELRIGGPGWSGYLNISPVDPDTGRPSALNRLELEIEQPALPGVEASAELAAVFADAHGPATTGFAAVHPKSTRYRGRAGPRFAYFFDRLQWLTFLGPWHLPYLRSRPDLSPARTRWLDDGVYIQVCDALEDVVTREGERRRVAIEQALRRAWRPPRSS